MRGKKAKEMRRFAQSMTVGKDDRKYTDVALNKEKPTRRTRKLYDCTRQVYKALKRQYKALA